VDGMETIGDILTKISTDYVMNLHVAFSFMWYFVGFIACVIVTVHMFKGIPLYTLHVYVYY